MSLRLLIVGRLPPVLVGWARRVLRRSLRFTAVAGGWERAVILSSGYDGEDILRRSVSSARAVKHGEAAFERDGILFKERAVAFQLAAPLLQHALKHGGQLEVVDFGGSLGSTFHQLRPFLRALRSLRWYVVEQPQFVAAGRAEFETDELSFYESVDELPSVVVPRIVLLSSVLQYLSSPHERFASLGRIGAETIVIDRTPFSDLERDQLCIQHVPSSLYKTSYPCWVFSRHLFSKRCDAAGWHETLRFLSAEGEYRVRGGGVLRFEGCILEAQQ